MDHKPDFFEKVLMGFLKKNILFSEIFFWWLLLGIVSFIPHNEQILYNIGIILGIRLLALILFLLPSFLIWLLKLLPVGDKPEKPIPDTVTQP
jgi:hypothetical protein